MLLTLILQASAKCGSRTSTLALILESSSSSIELPESGSLELIYPDAGGEEPETGIIRVGDESWLSWRF